MNHTMLSTALLTVLSTAAYADTTTQPPAPTNAAGVKSVAPQPVSPAPAPVLAAPVTPSAASTPTDAKPSNIPAPQTAPVINCTYHIPAETTTIEQSVISTWAKKAAVQSFDFNPATVDEELGALKSCYTDQGWQGFNDALVKSGNINAIKSQHLTVSSQVDGEVKINAIKDNQWKVNVPVEVVYQNDKEKLTQLLTIDLLIGRKISGDLGIMQMIATPRPTTTSPVAGQAQPSAAAQEPSPAASEPKPTTAAGSSEPAPAAAAPAPAPISAPHP